ncbi:MAG: tRNA (guanosine(46)-N7)-methyltransferase TrmB [Planctomycetota bacterium]|nr:tRNA (guanosine(46)-N7)-methyltransferase TrmB [Planctomycetota bacterium]
MSKRRIRHHVNPLNFREEIAIPKWSEVFEDMSRELEVDIGCAKGHFLMARAAQAPDVNIVGLEIRRPMVELVQERITKRSLKNCHVLCCNANMSLRDLFGESSLDRAYVHFPDPWFKKRHHKRRLIKAPFLIDLAAVLKIGGEFHFATDYQEYAEEMLAFMELNPDFAKGQRLESAHGLLTDREAWHSSKGDPVHRYLFKLERREATEDMLVIPEKEESEA